jgi:hypothetical protein
MFSTERPYAIAGISPLSVTWCNIAVGESIMDAASFSTELVIEASGLDRTAEN